MNCKICDAPLDLEHKIMAEELMFGMKEHFAYYTCSNCKCVQIGKVPSDLTRFYPEHYYSYGRQSEGWLSHLKVYFQKFLFEYKLGDKGNLLGWMFDKKYGHLYAWMKPMTLPKNAKILDVGCGTGMLLKKMKVFGYTNLTGADPFIQEDLHFGNGLNIYKKTIFDLNGTYDVIMLHHSLEHMDDQRQVIRRLGEMLNPSGVLILGLPVSDGILFKRYGKYWFGFDAPRHLYLHTRKSVATLAKQNGFVIRDIIDGTVPLEIWCSELYKKGIPLSEVTQNPFTKTEMQNFEDECREINRKKQATIVTFYLEKEKSPPEAN